MLGIIYQFLTVKECGFHVKIQFLLKHNSRYIDIIHACYVDMVNVTCVIHYVMIIITHITSVHGRNPSNVPYNINLVHVTCVLTHVVNTFKLRVLSLTNE